MIPNPKTLQFFAATVPSVFCNQQEIAAVNVLEEAKSLSVNTKQSIEDQEAPRGPAVTPHIALCRHENNNKKSLQRDCRCRGFDHMRR